MFCFETKTGFKIEIPTEFNGYKFIEFLSNGQFSAVAKVEEIETGEIYAAKIISMRDMEEKNQVKMISNEIQILQSIDHPNIIKLFETFFIQNEDNELFLVMIIEYCPNGDLVQFISNGGLKNEEEKRRIEFQVLEAIEFIHEIGIAHCDLKPDNILLDEKLTPKLCDFGLSKDIHGDNHGIMNGCLQYSAPELFDNEKDIDYLKADVFAIGITFYVITELKLPYVEGTTIKKGKLEIASHDDEINEFVEKCTKMNPNERPTITDLLDEGFFSTNDEIYEEEEDDDDEGNWVSDEDNSSKEDACIIDNKHYQKDISKNVNDKNNDIVVFNGVDKLLDKPEIEI